ncbi:bacterial transcriptional activator domain-containing protein [Cellulomonas sp. KRMCY2]|uniref:AfsR/SARP family transcriptional regulator n=1 Tax=Cellulomonas sp. KRMCY2 TaxID=1304865 RepID=UPI0012DC7D41|nr:bacterial transcriptional activator domain-containing protein [Cellulomonas sp. KRMCY2]
MTELLTTASPPAPDQPLAPSTATPADEGARAALAALPIPRPPAPEPGESDGARGLRINVLGTVEIENVPTEQRLTPRQTELLVYLALRGETSGPAMDEDLWPGSRTDGVARWGLAYRTRRIVLDHNLPRTEKGDALRLGPGATCDWDDFRRLAMSGLAADAAGVADLQHALDLVRGRPLTGVPPNAYAWADRDTDTMISTVADVSLSLARHLLDSGDSRNALSAAMTGLAADPCSEDLREIAVAAALGHGDIDEARRIQDRHAALLAELDDEYV